MEIVDNVLSEKTFNNIVNYTCNNNDFPWNLVQNGVSIPGDGKYQFIHEFKSETGVMSPYNYLLRNLYLRLGVNTLWRCKMNLKIKTKNLKQKLLWEISRAGEKFPHLYDKLTLENVVKVDYPNV